ncbi:MAG TPA: ATP-binding protein [Actinomycetota bacterium]|nr:ATP-binding protein [Actinomycetota bacterium]
MASEAEPGMRGLWLGILVFRWATFAWMAIAAATRWHTFRRPGLALAAVLITGAWNAWFSLTWGWRRPRARWVDLAIAIALLPVSGLVMAEGAISRELFFATAYPASAALTMGAGAGLAGLLAGAALSVGLVFSRLANGLAPGDLIADWANLVNGSVYYLAAAAATGVVRRVLVTSAAERADALEEAARQRDRAVRLAERDALSREIHDSVLQALALVGKKGKELANLPSVPPEELRELIDLTARQERALRTLLSEPPGEPPEGMMAVKAALDEAASGIRGVPVTVTSVGLTWMPTGTMSEVARAVHEALENVVEHAQATRATVFAEEVDRQLVISVRDDGVGFTYDEERLARDGKLGLLKSMKGRVEGLRGAMAVHTAEGRGTEVEFRLPMEEVTSGHGRERSRGGAERRADQGSRSRRPPRVARRDTV